MDPASVDQVVDLYNVFAYGGWAFNNDQRARELHELAKCLYSIAHKQQRQNLDTHCPNVELEPVAQTHTGGCQHGTHAAG